MYYAYILRSERFPNQTYVGSTGDLRRRLAEHNAGKSTHTSKSKPWELVIYVAFQEQAGGRVADPSARAEVNAYLLRVPHSLRGWQRVRVLKFSNFHLASTSGVHALFSPY